MSDRNGFDWLSNGIAGVLRIGTLVSVGIIAVGYLIGLVGGFGDGRRPLLELIGGGGPLAIVGIGLLAMTLLPVGVLIAASIGFARSGERRRMLTSIAVLGLLLASLVAAAFLAQAG
jgi:uncharacterized membrane protein